MPLFFQGAREVGEGRAGKIRFLKSSFLTAAKPWGPGFSRYDWDHVLVASVGQKSIVSQSFKAITARQSSGQPLHHPLTSTAQSSGGTKRCADGEVSAFVISHICFTVQSLRPLSSQKTIQKWGKHTIVSYWQQFLSRLN